MAKALVPAISILILLLAVTVTAQGQSRWLGTSARNTQVELSVFDLTTMPLADQPSRLKLIVATAWRNLASPQRMDEIEWKTEGVGGLATFGRARPPRGRGAVRHTAYLVPRLADHLYLITGTGGMARLADEDEIRLSRQDDEVERLVSFEIDRGEAEALLLVFFDFDHGHITIPLTQRIPPREGSAPMSEARNELVRARVYTSRMQADLLEVDLGLMSTSVGNAVEVDLQNAIGLTYTDGTVAEPTASNPAHWREGMVRILPEWEQRGRLLFMAAGGSAPVSLELSLPDQPPLRLPLVRGAAAAPSTAPALPALHGWEDGEGVRLELLQASQDPKTSELVLRVRVINRCGSDLTFSFAAQFLLDAGGRVLSPANRTEADGWSVRHGATRTMELRYPLKRMAARATLRYRGFENETVIPLEVQR